MRYVLADLARRARNQRRRKVIVRDIVPPATLATDLYLAGYRPVVEIWQRRTSVILGSYERTLSELTTDSPQDMAREIEEGEAALQRIILELTAAMTDWSLKAEAWYRGKWRGAILAATGVDIGTLIGPADMRETLQALIQRNVALMKDVSAQAQGRMSDAVFRGLTNRTPAREVAAELRKAVDMARDRSLRIASDQLTKATSALADERRREAGIEQWRWRHSGKRHPREDHVARNGKIYADTKAGGGDGVLPPPDDRPGQLPYCGCRAQSVVTFD